ncbi:MAG TPA: hydroxyacid dehydrogenase, partial [Actinobacteria bacterium]|nr:hydroxyacid dehydrogenase [Actinomycetota bacterium]
MVVRRVAVTFPVGASDREAMDRALGGAVQVDVLADLSDAERLDALRAAEALLLWNWARELRGPEEREAIAGVRFIQLISAGADHIPFDEVPPGALLASNVGAYAEPMAEHVLAMVLSLAKKLPQNHAAMARGEWNQFALNRSVKGLRAAILGFGGIGKAVARLLRSLGVEILAVQ